MRPGETVWIDAWSHRRRLVNALARAVERCGARAEVALTDEHALLRRLRESPVEELRRPEPRALRLARKAEVCLELGGPRDGRPFGLLPSDRLTAYLEGLDRVEEVWREGRGRGAYLQLGLDTPPRAARYGHPLRSWRRQLIEGTTCPPSELEQLASGIEHKLGKASNGLLLSGGKTALWLRFEPSSARLDTGRLGDSTLGSGQRYTYLPAGVLSVRLRASGATGSVVVPGPFVLGGERAVGIRLEIRRGRVLGGSLQRGGEAASSLIRQLVARRERLSLVHVGLNPHLRPLGYFGDRAAAGTITLTLGDDRLFGGSHASPIALDLCLSRGTPRLGMNPVVTAGRLIIDQ